MDILFIGGTGVISSACSQAAVERGFNLFLLNRGRSARPVPEGASIIQGDIRDVNSVAGVLEGRTFDVVADWIAYTPDHIETDLRLFSGRTGQFIFISSASVYQTPPQRLPVTEQTPLENPRWEYSRNKIACEQRLRQAFFEKGFPATIVRPSHTYDQTMLPVHGGYTVIDRMRSGKPVVVHGDGSSLWTLTHHADFANAFTGLLGHSDALGEAFHITSDELLTWNQIFETLAGAAGAQPDFVHLPSDYIAAFDPIWGDSLLGDKTHSMIFDNAKIKKIVPEWQAVTSFAQGAREIISWYDADPARRAIDPAFDNLLDRMIRSYRSAWPA